MKKIRESLKDRRFVAGSISVSILALLFLAGPVQAFILGLNVDNTTPNKGENITFTATLNIEKLDKFLPVKNLTLVLNGPEYSDCVFDINGAIESGCKGMTIKVIDNIYSNDNGYGYNYGYDYGYDYGYSYGYGYNYGYGYGYSYGKIALKYEITLDTTNYTEGAYDTLLRAIIGEEVFSKDGDRVTISDPSTEEEPEKLPKTYSNTLSTFYVPENTSSNETENGSGNGGNGNETTLGIEGDDIPETNGGLLSAITGGVIGTLGTTGTAVSGLFILIVLGGFGFVSYRKRLKNN